MKRFFFSAIALIVTATACTESGLIETPDSYGNPIVFDTYVGKAPITKAENVDGNYLKAHGVRIHAFTCPSGQAKADKVDFDLPYMDGALYHDSSWGYHPVSGNTFAQSAEDVYWPGWGVDLAFTAYSLNADNSKYISNSDNTKFTFKVHDTVSEQVDLLVAPLTFVAESGLETSVRLQLYHLLSRIGFKVLATPGTSTAIEISSVKLCGAFPKTGQVNLTSATNATNATKTIPTIDANVSGEVATSYNLFASDEKFNINSSDCDGTAITDAAPIYNTAATPSNNLNRYMMIMPGVVSNASIEVMYKLGSQEKPHTARIELGEMYFKAGSAYEFIFKVATAAIEFSATVVEGGWDEQTPSEHPLS